MPIQRSVSVCNKGCQLNLPHRHVPSEDELLVLLRKHECLAYHYVCGAFRAQGHLTSEKLKLLKEIQVALEISDDRHRGECIIASNNEELNMIAECMAGPDTDLEWRKEGLLDTSKSPMIHVESNARQMVEAVNSAFSEALKQSSPCQPSVTATIKLKRAWFKESKGRDSENKTKAKPKQEVRIKEEKRHDSNSSKEKITEKSNKDEEKDTDVKVQDPDKALMPPPPPVIPHPLSSAVATPTTSPLPPTILSTTDAVSLPPSPPVIAVSCPSPVISVTSPSSVTDLPSAVSPTTIPPTSPALISIPPTSPVSHSSLSPVITVPPPSFLAEPTNSPVSPSHNVITVPPLTPFPSAPNVITVPPPSNITVISSVSTSESPLITTPPAIITSPSITDLATVSSSQVLSPTQSELEEIPILTDDVQFISFPECSDSSLPPLVVVPPPEPVITVPHSSSFPSVPTSTLVIPSGMTIQLREDNATKKRKRTLSQDSGLTNWPVTKSIVSYSQISKMTPVMVSAPGQVKVTPIISRSPKVTQTSSLPTNTQKVIIVSNTSSGSVQRSINVPVSSMNMPLVRAMPPRLRAVTPTRVRAPRMVSVPSRGRGRGNQVMIPVGKKLQNFVMETSMKRLPLGAGPTKILPKPQGSMVIVNSGQTTSLGGGQALSRPAPVVEATPSPSVNPKQNVVLIQKGGKGGGQRALTLSNTSKVSKDLMQKLMSNKKCVVIQSSKVLSKNISSKLSPPPVTTSSASNVVVVDLSQEQYRQNLSGTTIAEILQASGIMCTSSVASAVTSVPPLTTSVSDPEPNSAWLSDDAPPKDISMEEVTLPMGQSESVVTLDEAVDLLGETSDQPQTLSETLPEMLPSSETAEQMFTISSEELAASDVTFLTNEKPEADNSQIIIESMPTEVAEIESMEDFLHHKDEAVTIQHSNIDMPANMCLEEYSSQQMENQGLH